MEETTMKTTMDNYPKMDTAQMPTPEVVKEPLFIFEIDESIANKLSDALTRKKILMEAYVQSIGDIQKSHLLENKLVNVETTIDRCKSIISGMIPDEYRSDRYEWIYNGWIIDGCRVSIYEVTK